MPPLLQSYKGFESPNLRGEQRTKFKHKAYIIRPLYSSTEIQAAVASAETELADTGRIVLRASGTEPVIRVMVEGEDHDQVVSIANRLATVVAESAA